MSTEALLFGHHLLPVRRSQPSKVARDGIIPTILFLPLPGQLFEISTRLFVGKLQM